MSRSIRPHCTARRSRPSDPCGRGDFSNACRIRSYASHSRFMLCRLPSKQVRGSVDPYRQ
jgi:hypothetical protein